MSSAFLGNSLHKLVVNRGLADRSDRVKAKLVGKHLDAAAIRRVVTLTIQPTKLIREELLSAIAKDFAQNGFSDKTVGAANVIHDAKRNMLQGTGAPGVFTAKTYKEAAVQFTAQAKKISFAHYAFYVALLKAMDELVRDPGIPAEGKTYRTSTVKTKQMDPVTGRMKTVSEPVITSVNRDVRFNKTIPFLPEGLGNIRSKQIKLSGAWPGLSAMTMQQKETGLGAPVFWKHTGEASQALHAAVAARLAKIKPESFVVRGMTEARIGGSTLAKQGAGKYYAKAKYSFRMGIPSWNQKMDALITLPFATQQLVSSLTASGLIKFDENGHEKRSFKTSNRKLNGIDRLLVAEAYRPWLRHLSIMAGAALSNYLHSGTAPRNPRAVPSKHPIAQRRNASAKAKVVSEKLKAANERAMVARENKRLSTIAKFRSHMNNTGRMVVRASTRKGETIRTSDEAIKAINAKVVVDRAAKRIKSLKTAGAGKEVDTFVAQVMKKARRATTARMIAEAGEPSAKPKHTSKASRPGRLSAKGVNKKKAVVPKGQTTTSEQESLNPTALDVAKADTTLAADKGKKK